MMAIQIAKWMGAQVAMTASPRGDALVRRLGADQVIDYTRQKPGTSCATTMPPST